MVHIAFDSFQLVPNSAAIIDAIESCGSTLVSCSDGSLRIYGIESSVGEDRSTTSTISDFYNHALELKKEPYVLEWTINGFSKKPMLAMEVIKSRELLLSLSESITFHRLPNLEILAVITKAKEVNAYSWDESRGVPLLRAAEEGLDFQARWWARVCGGERIWCSGPCEFNVMVW